MSVLADTSSFETNPLPYGHHGVERKVVVELDDPRLAKVTRLRLLANAGFPYWDVSYCHGVLKDGTNVRVDLPKARFLRSNLKGEIIAMANQAGVFAKRLGLLDESIISKIW